MTKTLYVIINKKKIINDCCKKKDVFTLNEFILSEEEKKNCHHIYPDPKISSLKAEELIVEIKKIKLEIFHKLKNIYLFKEIKHLEELLEPLLELKISRFLYLKNSIPKYDEYILINNDREIKINSKIDLILTIDKIYCDPRNKKNDFLKNYFNFKFNIYNFIFLKIQNKILNKLLQSSNNNIYFLSDKRAYFLDLLKNKIKIKKNIILYYIPTSSYLKIIFIVFKQLYNLILKKDIFEIGIFILPYNKRSFRYSEIRKNEKIFNITLLDNKFNYYLIKQLYSYIMHTISNEQYIKNLFKNIKVKKSYFHSVRFPDLFSFSQVLNKLNNNIYLISHGSHTIQDEKSINFLASQSMGIGLAYTNQKGIKLLSQSIYCDNFLNSIKKSYFKINRILTSSQEKNVNKYIQRKESKLKILYVGTVKQLGERRYYFESSSEFFESIKYLYNKLKIYKNIFEVTISIREVKNEINNEILYKALKDKSDLLTIGKSNTIYDEIQNCDCLISFSSTTLEEGLDMNKPAMCFGLPKYNHFKEYENLDNQSLEKYYNQDLKIIENCLGKRFIFKNPKKREINYLL